MTFAKEKAAIETWSERASAAQLERAAHRAAVGQWKRDRFARPSTLAAAFAAGLWWGYRRDTDTHLGERAAHTTKKALGLVNTSLFAWRLLGARVDAG